MQEPFFTPRDTLVLLPSLGRRKRVYIEKNMDKTFIALGTWVHPQSREYDLVASTDKYKVTGGFILNSDGSMKRTFR
jgi:hypothetical protein